MAAISRVYVASQLWNDVINYLQVMTPEIKYIPHQFVKSTPGVFSLNVPLTPQDFEALKDAEILITDNVFMDKLAYRLPKLKWIQGTYAGIEQSTDKLNGEIFKLKGKVDFIATRFSGDSYGQMFLEYCISFFIAYERGFVHHISLQESKDWKKLRSATPIPFRTLKDVTFAILGVGAIGSYVARGLNSLGCKVIGFGYTCKDDEFLKSNGLTAYSTKLKDVISEVDCVVNILPHTKKTVGLLDGMFHLCKNKPIFINLGRATIVSENQLIDSLDKEYISMAVLDVLREEPLPPENALWSHPKILITPHVASKTRSQDLAKVFVDNLDRFSNGLELKYRIDWDSGY